MEAKLGSKPRTLQKALSSSTTNLSQSDRGALRSSNHSLTARHIHANQVSVVTVPVAGSSTLFSYDTLVSLAADAIDESLVSHRWKIKKQALHYEKLEQSKAQVELGTQGCLKPLVIVASYYDTRNKLFSVLMTASVSFYVLARI